MPSDLPGQQDRQRCSAVRLCGPTNVREKWSGCVPGATWSRSHETIRMTTRATEAAARAGFNRQPYRFVRCDPIQDSNISTERGDVQHRLSRGSAGKRSTTGGRRTRLEGDVPGEGVGGCACYRHGAGYGRHVSRPPSGFGNCRPGDHQAAAAAERNSVRNPHWLRGGRLIGLRRSLVGIRSPRDSRVA